MQIEDIPILSSLPHDELENLLNVMNHTEYEAGTVLFREGEPGNNFYIIVAGQVEIIKALGTAEEQLLGVGGTSDFFGEMSLLVPDGLRTASARTSTAVEMLELSHADLNYLLQRRPMLAYEFVRVLSLRLKESENLMIRDLKEKNRQLSLAYEDLKTAQVQIVEKKKLEHELDLAQEIQQSILPKNPCKLTDFDFGARMVPARTVGGDLYDFISLSEDTVAIVIGDVSDKGIPAAIFMALFCSLLRAEVHHASTPAEVLRRINLHLLELKDSGMFVTALIGVLNRENREFSYARAGHEIPILFDQYGEANLVDWDQGQLLGFFPDPKIDVQSVILPPGSTLILYTDGAFDAHNLEGAVFGMDRLIETARGNILNSAQNICNFIVNEINNYQGLSSQYDDITLVAIHSLP